MNNGVKDEIVRMAAEYFTQYGIKGTTMELIAGSLNISKRTLYQCFPDKRDLLQACVKMRIEESLHTIITETNGTDALYAIFRMNCIIYELFTAQYPAFRRDILKYREVQELLDQEYHTPLAVIASDLFDRAKAEGAIAKDADLRMTLSFFGNLLLTFKVDIPEDTTHADAYRYTLRTYLAGICTDSGRERLKNFNINHQ